MAIILRPSSPVMLLATVVSGPKSLQSDLTLLARVGNNGESNNAEVSLAAAGGSTVNAGATWDQIHGGTVLSPFLSVFQVRLTVDAESGVCRASAGTMPWLQVDAEPFTAIESVELSATVRHTTAQREASWESAYVQFRYGGGYSEELFLDALPRAVTPQKFRQSAQEPPQSSSVSNIEQYAALSGQGIIGFTVVGLIRFRANEPPAPRENLGPDDLQVSVNVFTNASPPEQGFGAPQKHRPHKPPRA